MTLTKENKELLLKDLSARLPYNPMVEYKGEIYNVLGITVGRLVLCKPFMSCALNEYPLVEEVKLYLFPLSSMTEEQQKEEDQIKQSYDYDEESFMLFDWYNKNHFDYRGLISIDLALNATELGIY